MTDGLLEYMAEAQNAMANMSLAAIEDVVRVMKEAWEHDRQVFLMGNGGSAATASHFVNDLNKTAILPRKSRFRAISLNDNVPLITAWANDASYEDIFAQQMLNYVESGDILVGISTSGNSPNIVKALQLGRSVGAITVGLTGFSGGQLKGLVDYCVSVPTDDVMQIEGLHSVILHAMIARFKQLVVEDGDLATKSHKVDGSPRPAVFVDRDGVINENREDYVKTWEEFRFLPGVIAPLRKLARNNHAVVIISNQSAVGRGIMSREAVDEINNRMLEVINNVGGRVDGVFYCPHDSSEGCECRKPKPGLLIQAAEKLGIDLEKSVLIGDALTDVEAAVSAGCAPIFVLTGRGKEELSKLKAAGFNNIRIVDNLAEAVEVVPLSSAQKAVE